MGNITVGEDWQLLLYGLFVWERIVIIKQSLNYSISTLKLLFVSLDYQINSCPVVGRLFHHDQSIDPRLYILQQLSTPTPPKYNCLQKAVQPPSDSSFVDVTWNESSQYHLLLVIKQHTLWLRESMTLFPHPLPHLDCLAICHILASNLHKVEYWQTWRQKVDSP